jgi:hypothetical protein
LQRRWQWRSPQRHFGYVAAAEYIVTALAGGNAKKIQPSQWRACPPYFSLWQSAAMGVASM